MPLVLNNGLRKNGATRFYLPRPPQLAETLPRLAEPAQAPLPCPAFNRPWVRPGTVQQTLALWAACPSHTEAHQLACRLILGLQDGVIEVMEEETSTATTI